MSALKFADRRLLAGRRGLMFVTVLFVNFVVWLDSWKFALLAPFWSEDLHLTTAQIGSVTASYLLGYFPMLLVAGVLADRVGAKQMLLISITGVTMLSGSMAYVDSYGEMWWRNLVFGVFFGFLWAPSQRLLAAWFPGPLNARATSTWVSSVLVASVVAPAIALPLAHYLSWEDAFLIVAALGVPAFFMIVFWTANQPVHQRGISPEEVAAIRADHHGADVAAKLPLKEVLRFMKKRSVMTMIIATALTTTPTWLSLLWMPYGLITIEKIDPVTVAWVTSLLAAIPVLFGLIHGSLVARFFGGRLRPWLAMGPACGVIGFSLAIVTHDSNWVLWAFLLGAIAFLADPMFFGTANSYWAAIARPEVTGTLNGAAAAAQVAVGWFITAQSGKWIDASASGRAQLDLVWVIGALIFAGGIIPVLLSKEVRVHDAVAHGPEMLEETRGDDTDPLEPVARH